MSSVDEVERSVYLNLDGEAQEARNEAEYSRTSLIWFVVWDEAFATGPESEICVGLSMDGCVSTWDRRPSGG